MERLARRFGTPLYVYSATAIQARVAAFERAFEKQSHSICYSVKANSNLAVLRLLASLGCGFDVVSGGELQRVIRVGKHAAAGVVFSGVGKTAARWTRRIEAGILLFNVESEAELALLGSRAAKLKKTARIAFRVNPDVKAETHPYISTGLRQHKFGVPIARPVSCTAEGRGVCLSGPGGRERAHRLADHRREALWRDHGAGAGPGARVDRRRAEHQFVDAGGGLGIRYENAKGGEATPRNSSVA